MDLPIDPLLPEISRILLKAGRLVLQAPPGAGKTSRVPLALLDVIPDGKIILLEPRRLAARAAAERLASSLGEPVGQRVGYRMRGDTRTGSRIEVVTEGVLTRMLQSDPDLPGISCLIFDEFHERSLNADLGLALAWEVRQALRSDLLILVMSATLDAQPVAELLDDAPVVTAEGRAFPVEIWWLPRPRPRKGPLAPDMAGLIRLALAETAGGVLAFLPGEREIREVAAALGKIEGVVIRELYGALPFARQQAAIAPVTQGRKVVLATSIAETSLTIDDIRVVVDAGLARRARFDPGTGMSRLVTEAATTAELTQRTGRAGRVAPGWCYRLCAKAEEGARPSYPAPEIAEADLSGLALDLAQWGSADLAFLTPPPEGAMSVARTLLRDLAALDTEGRITPHGTRIAAHPLHPRLAHMLEIAGPDAAPLAALLSDRDPMPGHGADLGRRLRGFRDSSAPKRLRDEANRLARMMPRTSSGLSVGQMAALAYPDRIGKRRPGETPRYLLSGGRGSVLDADDALANSGFLVVPDLDGGGREARIRRAVEISEADVREIAADRIKCERVCRWSKRDNRVVAQEREMLGAVSLSERRWRDVPQEAVALAMLEGVRQLGLSVTGPAARLQARVQLARAGGVDLPDMSDTALMDNLEDWLFPHLAGIDTASAWHSFELLPALEMMLDWPTRQALDRVAPQHFVTPLGRKVPIDYGSDPPAVALRLQELFGQTIHPVVGGRALKLTLLSPAGRPVQVTTDLPGFWATSYADVRKDMRGRYPKHPWPEDPTRADPTLRTKRRQ